MATSCRSLKLLLLASAFATGVSGAVPSVEAIAPPVRGFDFGPPGQQVWPGLTAVSSKSVYSPESGFGWRQPVTAVLGRDYGRHDPLTRDFCRPQGGDAAFCVDVPNGEYLVTVVFGDLQQFPVLFQYLMKLEGRPVIDWRPDEADFFKHADLGWWPGESLWKYMADRYRVETFPVEVTDGRLDVWMQRYFFLTALLIAPADQKGELEGTLQRIERDRKRLFEAAYPRVKPYVADTLSPESFDPPEADLDRGFTVFPRICERVAYPDSRPTAGELASPIKLAAAQGEAEPVTVCFLPYRDFQSVRVRLAGFPGPDGSGIPAETVTVYRTRFKEIVFGSRKKDHFVWPRMLDEVETIDADGGQEALLSGRLRPYPRDVLTQIWLTIRVPEEAKPGNYRGRLTLSPEASREAILEVRLRVHPFKLREPDTHYGMCHSPAYGLPNRVIYAAPDDSERRWGYVERDLCFMHDLGMRGIFTSFLPDGEWEEDEPKLDFAGYSRMLGLIKRSGLDGMLLNYGTSGASYARYDPKRRASTAYLDEGLKLDERYMRRITAYCRALAAESERAGWPTTYFATLDEASNRREQGWAAARQIGQAMKAGGVLTFETANGYRQLDYLDVVDLPVMNFAAVLKESTFDKIRRAGRRFGFYNIGWDRFTWGLYSWRVGACYRVQWHYRATSADPYNDFDGRKSDAATIAYPTRDKLIPTPFSERVREGIEDGWYLGMLEWQLARAPAASSAAKSARALIDRLKAQIPQDFSRYYERARRYDPEPGPPKPFAITPEEMDAIRAEVAEAIAALRAAQM